MTTKTAFTSDRIVALSSPAQELLLSLCKAHKDHYGNDGRGLLVEHSKDGSKPYSSDVVHELISADLVTPHADSEIGKAFLRVTKSEVVAMENIGKL